LISAHAALAQAPIPASKSSISIAGFTFRITAVAFDESALGFAPPEMKESDRVMFVEFELLAGDEENFKDLALQIAAGSGQRYRPVLLTADGMVQMLTTVTMIGRPGQYQPQKEHIAWVYMVPRSIETFQVHFPTGEIIDLGPLMEK
jgi:hypothetical protein